MSDAEYYDNMTLMSNPVAIYDEPKHIQELEDTVSANQECSEENCYENVLEKNTDGSSEIASRSASKTTSRSKYACCMIVFTILLLVVAIIASAFLSVLAFSETSGLQSKIANLEISVQMIEEIWNSSVNPVPMSNIQLVQLMTDQVIDSILSEYLVSIPTSCADVLQVAPSSPSGYYRVRSSNGSVVQVYCDLGMVCGGRTGGWMRVADLDVNDTSQTCPSPWILKNTTSGRACTPPSSRCGGSVFFSAHAVKYSRVCGRAVGYSFLSPDAFVINELHDINNVYLDGVSVTHGLVRQHIWSFAAEGSDNSRCPCRANSIQSLLPPSFVGRNYFCDGYYNGALWDKLDCLPSSDCCAFNCPPWFNVSLSNSTSDDMEVRICTSQTVDDEAVQLQVLQLFVQ